MKRKPRITSFAKLVIAVLIFFGLRYAYLHREEILSSDFFNFLDSTESVENEIDTTNVIVEIPDSLPEITADSIPVIKDSIEIKIIRNENILLIEASGTTVSIPLKDTLLTADTIPFKAFEKNNIYGRVIIQ